MPEIGWLNVIYRLPSKPSTLRVNVWKQVKDLGGLSLQQSTYAFPDRPRVRVGLAQIQRQVEVGGGDVTLFEIPILDASQEKAFIAELVRLRDDEYKEILQDCEELAHRIERKTERESFDREETEDARDNHTRIQDHFEMIAARDYFGGVLKSDAKLALRVCGDLVADFARHMETVDGERTQHMDPESAALHKPKRMKEQTHHACAMSDAIVMARRTLDDFEAGTLMIGSLRVENLSESALLELKYSDRDGKRCLEIEVEW